VTRKKDFYLPRLNRHTPKSWQGAAAKATSASTPEEIVQKTPTMKALDDFLKRPLPDGTPPTFHPRSTRGR
jgi:hypothetical protein